MSFFYLTPVRGDIPVHLLETIVNNRLDHLKLIIRGDSSTYNEYVVEGSVHDNVGHFMLFVVAILGERLDFTRFFLMAELELFKQRLLSLSGYDLRCFGKRLLRNIRKHEYTPSFIDPLQVLCQHIMIKDVAQHICSPTHSESCSVHTISMNFKHCLPFVAKRQVELSNGIAYLPCSKWKQFLIDLFGINLKYRLRSTDLTPLKSDPRVTELLMKQKNQMFPYVNPKNTSVKKILLSKEVDSFSTFFPPCMLNLHRNLRNKHRLSHSQRFCYSLFLKDIGMPVEEAIDFWKTEYSKSPNGHHSCCHNWERDEKKYLYGIRHMYGLEGARKSYASGSCQRIQSNDNSCSEGGCPFKFDDHKMRSLLSCNDFVLSQINEKKRNGQYTSACMVYLQIVRSVQTTICDSTSFNFTPVKYYFIASKSNSMNS